jgi:hypothetical protein
MATKSTYRIENGEPCIDVKLASLEHAFDKRDPAPFRERDLDPSLSEYLLDAGEDLAGENRIRVVFWIDQLTQSKLIEEAVHAHFEYLIERSRRQRRRHVRTGRLVLLLAILLAIALLSLSQLIATWVPGALGATLHEGLLISSWVVMWRPAEMLLYDWIPVRHERRIMEKLLTAPVDVRVPSVAEPQP